MPSLYKLHIKKARLFSILFYLHNLKMKHSNCAAAGARMLLLFIAKNQQQTEVFLHIICINGTFDGKFEKSSRRMRGLDLQEYIH